MRIALVIPPYDIIGQGYGSKTKYKGIGYWPPLGVGYIAAVLEKEGHEITIIDAPPKRYSNEDVCGILEQFGPDIVGVSSLTASAGEAYALIKDLKKSFGVPIVFGGIHVTCFPDEVLEESPETDVLVLGEGEETVRELVRALEQKSDLKGIHGIWYRDGKTVIKNPPRPPGENLDSISSPSWHLYNYEDYIPLPLQYKRLPVAAMITSRGCPWRKCTYCFQSGRAAQPYRRHSPRRVIDEMKHLISEHGIREIAFWDDNFLINERWVNEFCDLFEEEGVGVPWQCYGRANTVTESMLKKVAQVGCWNVFYGIESGNQDLLDNINKGITLRQIEDAVRWTHEAGLDTRGALMLALPGETPEKALRTIDFAVDLDLTFALFLPTHPEYGTALYDDASKKGTIVPRYKGRTTATFIPRGYKDAAEVESMVRKAYRRFYLRPKYFFKHLRRIRSLDLLKQYYKATMLILGIGF